MLKLDSSSFRNMHVVFAGQLNHRSADRLGPLCKQMGQPLKTRLQTSTVLDAAQRDPDGIHGSEARCARSECLRRRDGDARALGGPRKL